MRTRTLSVLLAGLVLLAGVGSVSAQDADEGGDGASDPDDIERTVEVRSSAQGVTMELQREDEPDVDPIEVRFDPPNATLHLVYGGGEGTSLSVAFEALVEYVDDNENDTYDFGEPIVSATPLLTAEDEGNRSEANRTQWAAPIVTNTTTEGADGQRVLAPAQIAGNGSFAVEMRAFGERVRMQNTTMGPTSVHVGLAIESYPFQRDDTGLALFLAVQMDADQTGQQHRARGENERGFVTAGETGDRSVNVLFAWSTRASVDGQTSTVRTTQMAIEAQDDEEDQTEENRRQTSDDERQDRPWQIDAQQDITERYVLSYTRGERIDHSAEGEVALASVEGNGTPTGPALACAAIAAAALVFRRETT